MKIIHTADWHIGKKLHRKELKDDFDLFIDWLVGYAKREAIDLLLVSGDIFDLANPSSEARAQYYRSLVKLHTVGCKIILTGGNHDSPNMLNAPKEILHALDIHIIGGMPDRIEDAVILVESGDDEKIVIGAIPYLRDSDLRKSNEGESYNDILEAIQKGIENSYHQLNLYCKEYFAKIPVVAMGHLYTAGSIVSDSEREIQIGNQALFHASRFGKAFEYMALGHIHKPQKITADIPVYYSGSPLPLSFSEREDKKRILLLDTKVGFDPISIDIPQFRRLIRISGSLSKIQSQLMSLKKHNGLDHLIEVHLLEEVYNVEKIYKLEEIINDFEVEGYEIVHRTIDFKNNKEGIAHLYQSDTNLEELSPIDVFQKMLENRAYDATTVTEITNAFHNLYEEVLSDENLAV